MRQYLTSLLLLLTLSVQAQFSRVPKDPGITGLTNMAITENGLLMGRTKGQTAKALAIPAVLSKTGVRALNLSSTAAPQRIDVPDAAGGAYYLDAGDTTTPDNTGTVLVTTSGLRYKRDATKGVSITDFGAIAGDSGDDGAALLAALNSSATVIIIPTPTDTTQVYRIAGPLVLSNLRGKTIQAGSAKILNTTNTRSFLFEDCRDISIQGGRFGLLATPTSNGNNDQHVFQFTRCQRINVTGAEILNSSEMGFAFTYCNQVTVQDSYIHNTFRDGVYCRYSANVRVLRNVFRHCKDDAVSFHSLDYSGSGSDAGRSTLVGYGYQQATNCLVEGNDISNTYQGVVTIAGDSVTIQNNRIRNTVLSGIGAYNFINDSGETVKNLTIRNNTLTATNTGAVINGTFYENNGQAGPGRAAIFISPLGNNNQIGQGETKRISNVTLENNTVVGSGAHGLMIRLTDNVRNLGTTLQDCSGPVPAKSLPGIPFELGGYTGYVEDNLSIIDTRSTKLHQYAFNSTDGILTLGRRRIEGVAVAENLMNSTSYRLNNTKDGTVRGQSPVSNATFLTASQLNDDRPSGFYSVHGSVSGLPTDPSGFNVYFMVMNRLENDTVNPPFYATQELTRFDNVKFFRTRNEATGGWSAWKQVTTSTP